MKQPQPPFSLPEKLEPDLARVHAYWESLKRGDNNMPFWDDVNLSSLPDLSHRLTLIDVFSNPERFRLRLLGDELQQRAVEALTGKFLDEIVQPHPFEYLRAQCSVTVELRAPTYYRHATAEPRTAGPSITYARLLLPMWGDGHIGMLLGAVDWL